jgi:hypothetical protein
MASNTLSVDPRCITPLICSPENLSRFPKDSLHRVAITLELLSELIGNHNGESDLLESEDKRFALSMQLTSAAQVLEAVGDSLQIREPKKRHNEVIVKFSAEELEKLTIIAGREEQSIHDLIVGVVMNALRQFNPDKKPK